MCFQFVFCQQCAFMSKLITHFTCFGPTWIVFLVYTFIQHGPSIMTTLCGAYEGKLSYKSVSKTKQFTQNVCLQTGGDLHTERQLKRRFASFTYEERNIPLSKFNLKNVFGIEVNFFYISVILCIYLKTRFHVHD